jgi:mannose-6-phosphate isomerase-like protein (cupin superfamily)
MKFLDHNAQPIDEWRKGVRTKMKVSAVTGSVQLCMFDQWCDPGLGAPTHLHAVEEVLTVIAGRAEIWVGSETSIVLPGQSVIIPAGAKHGFRNVEPTGVLHMQAVIAASIFEATYDDRAELSRRYVPAA